MKRDKETATKNPDIAERKRTEDALRVKDWAIESAIDAIVTSDIEGNLNYVNTAFLKLWGYNSPAEVLGKPATGFWQMGEKAVEVMEAVRTKGGWSGELVAKRKDGTLFDVHVASSMVVDDAGQPVCLQASFEDITERKRAENALNKSQKCLKNVLDSLDSLVYVVDFNSYEILFINKYGHDTWGDVQGRKCWQAIQKDQKGPCSFCTNDKLVSNTGIPTGVYQWEFQNTVNGRWYECRDQAIPWTGKALVRMEIATDITERKQAEAKIKASEENYRTLIESASDQIFMVDKELLFMSINSVALSKLRKKLDEVIGKPASEVFPKEMSANNIKNLETVFKNGKDLFIDEELNFGGDIVFVNTSLSPVKNSAGETVSVLGVVRDITERKRVEEVLRESEEKLRGMFESIGDAVTVTNLEGDITEINEAAVGLWGYAGKEEVIGRKGYEFVAEENRPVAVQTTKEALNKRPVKGATEFNFVRKDGSIFSGEARAAMLKDKSGKPAGFISVVRDTTERKRAEEALRESTEMLSLFVKHSPIYAFIKNVAPDRSCVLVASENLKDLTGVAGSQMSGKTMEELFPPEFAAKITADDWAVASGDKVLQLDETLGNRYYTTIKFPITIGGKRLLAGYTIDITERKKAEDALRESEEKYRTVIEQSIDGIVITDEYGDVAIWNKSIVSLTGIQQWDTVGKPLWEVQSWLIPDEQKTPELLEQLQRMTENILKLRVDWPGESGEKIIVCADGTRKVVHVSSFLIKADNTLRFGSILRDITAHRRAEEALLESESRYRLIAENMADTVWLMDLDLKMTYISPSAVRTRGYTLEELNDMLLDRQITPESFELVMNILKSEMMLERLGQKGLKIAHSIELEFYRKDGTTFWAEVAMTLLRDADGNPTGMLGVGHDITERKKAEEALGKSEERFRIAAESTSDCVWERDIKKDSVDWFGDIDSLLGYKRDEFPRTIEAWGKAIHPEDRDKVMGLLHKHIIEHTPYDAKYRVVKKDGSIAFWVDRGTAVYDENGEIYKMFGAVKDITNSESMKEALVFSNIILRTQQEASIDGILVVDEKGGILSFNQRFVDMWGIPTGVIESKSDDRALQSVMDKLKNPEEFIRKVQHLYANQQETSRDEIALKDDRFFDRYSAPMFGEDGKYYGRVWYFRDIAEHKRAVEDLVKYKDHLEELAKDRTGG